MSNKSITIYSVTSRINITIGNINEDFDRFTLSDQELTLRKYKQSGFNLEKRKEFDKYGIEYTEYTYEIIILKNTPLFFNILNQVIIGFKPGLEILDFKLKEIKETKDDILLFIKKAGDI